jgi:hypothetical protein
MMKAYQAGRVSARTIVIGSSRPDLGIDPATNSWPASARPVYNLSLVGSGTTEGMKYLRHYLAMNPGHAPRTVVVGLDFESFLYVPSRGPNRRVKSGNTSELEERLAVDPTYRAGAEGPGAGLVVARRDCRQHQDDHGKPLGQRH